MRIQIINMWEVIVGVTCRPSMPQTRADEFSTELGLTGFPSALVIASPLLPVRAPTYV